MNDDKRVTTQTRPKRRLWRYSLRALLIIITLVCVWVAYKTERARKQAASVRDVQAIGGVLKFDYQLKSGNYDPNATPDAPAWLIETVGEEYFRRAIVLDLAYGHLSRVRSGERIAANDDLQLLRGLPDLETLEIGDKRQVTDDGLVHLAGLKNLRVLYLYRTGVKGEGLKHLRGLKRLESISLDGTPATDDAAEQVAQLPRLRWLALHNTRITDEALAHLAKTLSLEELRLSDTDITDEGLLHLHNLKSLKELSLHHTNVTSAGISKLEQALPDCSISPASADLQRQGVDLPPPTKGDPSSIDAFIEQLKQLGGSVEYNATAQELMVFDNSISGRSLAMLVRELPNLKMLNLRNLVVGDDLFEHMPVLNQATYVSLQNCRLTDASLAQMSKFPNVRELNLRANRIIDEGLKGLHGLKSLERVYVGESRVTVEGMEALQKALPNTNVGY
jgi:Leucine-rich repeat (LRR) protein